MVDPSTTELLEGMPDNWGTWGDDDEIGALNYLTSEEVLRGISSVERGEVYTLGLPIGRDEGDPNFPQRISTQHYMVSDQGFFLSGKRYWGEGRGSADDVVHMPLQGTTHVDALGHIWYDNEIYNGYDADSTMGGLEYCSVAPLANHGVLGRGVLLDIARYKRVDHLDRGERITLEDLKECADEQGISMEKRDYVLIRTGWLEWFYENQEEFSSGKYVEPGLTYSEQLVEWFNDMEIPGYGTDTLGNEQTVSETVEVGIPLHSALLRDMGLLFNEGLDLRELSASCAEDGKYEFLLIMSPLKFLQGTASPVNPLAVK